MWARSPLRSPTMAADDRPQITLITPPAPDLDTFAGTLARVMDTVEIACLRLSLATKDTDLLGRAADACREIGPCPRRGGGDRQPCPAGRTAGAGRGASDRRRAQRCARRARTWAPMPSSAPSAAPRGTKAWRRARPGRITSPSARSARPAWAMAAGRAGSVRMVVRGDRGAGDRRRRADGRSGGEIRPRSPISSASGEEIWARTTRRPR
jgi:hypothetical protein